MTVVGNVVGRDVVVAAVVAVSAKTKNYEIELD